MLRFNEQMAPGTVSDRHVQLEDAFGNHVDIDVLLSSDFTSAQIQPREPLQANTRYTLALSNGIGDASGNRLAPTTLTFFTAGSGSANVEPSRPAALSVRVTPQRAMPLVHFELDGKDMGNVPKLNIEIAANRTHTVKLFAQPPFSNYTLLLHEETFTARSGQNIDVSPRVRPFGALTVAAQPAADVFIDGNFVGSTPLAGYPLFSGEHHLELHPTADADRYSIYRIDFTLGPFERKSLGSVKLPRR